MSTSPSKQSAGRSLVGGERVSATWVFQFCWQAIDEFGLLLVVDCQTRAFVAGLRKLESSARGVGSGENLRLLIVRRKAMAQFDDKSGKSRRVPLAQRA
jgi:hypothetical protein